jgi:hypothetical protein
VTEPSSIKSLKALRTAEEACTRCPLYEDASQVVPGEGPARARLYDGRRSSRVTLIVDATVVVRKFRRLKPKALFAEDVIVGGLVLCVSDGSRLCDSGGCRPRAEKRNVSKASGVPIGD